MTVTLPDFDDMASLSEKIGDTLKKKLILELEIQLAEADIVKEVTTNADFFVNGKAPSMNLIDATYKFKGLQGELFPKRIAVAELTADVERYRRLYSILHDKIEVWRTQSANDRSSVVC
jgi:hypothetical protein